MKIQFIAIVLAFTSCGGSLSDEQRRKIREDMSEHKIVRISDAEITAAAFANGRAALKIISRNNKNSMDSLAQFCTIKWIVPGNASAAQIEQQLIEAYVESSLNGGAEDNIQKIGGDSLLYTTPVSEKQPDGSENIKGMWSIGFSKKQLILSLKK